MQLPDLWQSARTCAIRSSPLALSLGLLLLLLVPLTSYGAPAPDRLGMDVDRSRSHRRQDLGLGDLVPLQLFSGQAVTQTVVSTVMQTMTETEYTTVATASSTGSSPSSVQSLDTFSSPAASSPTASAIVDPAAAQAPSSSSAALAPSSSPSPTIPASSDPPAIVSSTGSSSPSSVAPAQPTGGDTDVVQPTGSPALSGSPSSVEPGTATATVTETITTSSNSSVSSTSLPMSSDVQTTSQAMIISSTVAATPTSSDLSSTTSQDTMPTSSSPPVFSPGSSIGHAAAPKPKKPLVMAYYPDWVATTFPPENIDFSRYDWVDFAFAVPNQSFQLGWDGDDDAPDLLKRLIAAAHQKGKFVKLSVGGWTGSKYFSSAVSTPKNRQTFANNILATYKQYGLDGIDIDWEFPGQQGADGNIVSPNDSANYLAFLQTLRQTLPATAKITAAVMTVPWADTQGNPMKDVSAFASVLDWILIMNYDTWGSSSTPGPNAPLSNACHNSTQDSASAVAGVMSWATAGFPASKITLGLPSYGYISQSSASSLVTRSVSSSLLRRSQVLPRNLPMHVDPTHLDLGPSNSTNSTDPANSTISALGSVDPTGEDSSTPLEAEGSKSSVFMVRNEDGGTANGQIQFRELVRQGALQYLTAWTDGSAQATAVNGTSLEGVDNTSQTSGIEDSDTSSDDNSDVETSSPSSSGADPQAPVQEMSVDFGGHQIDNVFNGMNGFVRLWDACSSSPFLRSAAAKQVVTFDDPQSLEMKAVFVREAGLLGTNMFDISGDTDQWDLTDGVRRGLGL